MSFPERFSNLPEYAFPRLRRLLDGHAPGDTPLAMSIGEPRHAFPPWLVDIIAQHASGFGQYPPNDGAFELRNVMAQWVNQRYGIGLDPETQIMVLNGTREGLYNAAVALSPESKGGKRPAVLMPNPFYQVYAVAALTAGAEPIYVPATRETGCLPDFGSLPTEVLDRTTVVYLCSPANPQGAVADAAYWRALIELAEKHDFRVFADECYSEIYRTDPPPGALQIAYGMGGDPERVLIFHSLSKRSNLPGLRSGFVAGGPQSIAAIKQLRAYAGAPVALPLQRAAETVWADEAHVQENRARYQRKYDMADATFAGLDGCGAPEAGFFLWLPVEDGEAATLKLWQTAGVRVLPGAYLARDTADGNPGKNYIRAAMVVDDEQELQRGLTAIRDCLYA